MLAALRGCGFRPGAAARLLIRRRVSRLRRPISDACRSWQGFPFWARAVLGLADHIVPARRQNASLKLHSDPRTLHRADSTKRTWADQLIRNNRPLSGILHPHAGDDFLRR